MALAVEGVENRSMDAEKALRRGLGFELLHLAFALADRQVGVLSLLVLAHDARAVDGL